MKTKFIEAQFEYDGSQLASLINYLEQGLLGDSVVSWVGPCDIPFDKMADGEDLLQRAVIRGAKMVHFIIEKFDISLYAAVGLQRLMASICIDVIKDLSSQKSVAHSLVRKGDDIYFENKKLSISVAVPATRSCLIHFAVNVNNQNTPVETLSLEDLKVDAQPFAQELMRRLADEDKDIIAATYKVHSV